MLERTVVVDQPAVFEDYRAAFRAHMFSRANAARLSLYPVMLLIVAIVYTVVAPIPAVLLPLYITLGACLVLAYLLAWFRGPKRSWKAYRQWGGLRYVFSEDGVSMTTGTGVLTMYPWSNVRRAVDSHDVILLYFNKVHYGYVSTGSLSPETQADLRALIASNVPQPPKQRAL